MLTDRSAELLAALRRTFPHWHCTLDGEHVLLTYGNSAHGHRPRRHPQSWSTMLATLADACSMHDIRYCAPLPLSGLGDAELTFSAVQGLDPYLKYGQNHVHARGFIPQPVVRFTGQRDEHGALLPGLATSFVNLSIVEPINTVDEHTGLIDAWIGALSQLGFHVQHLTISGHIAVWHRASVAGITLRFHHEGRELGDAVLLWNRDDQRKLATDIGSGLERLAWLLTHRAWGGLVHGGLAEHGDIRLLDAARTATLIVGAGIRPAPRGPGSAVRRLLRSEAARSSVLGVSQIVRCSHAYWSGIQPLPVPWPEVCRTLDTEIFDQTQSREAP